MYEELVWKSHFFRWEDVINTCSYNASIYEVLHLQKSVMVKLNCSQIKVGLKEGTCGYFDCVVQSIKHYDGATVVTVRSDQYSTTKKTIIDVNIGDIMPIKRMTTSNKSSIQVGQLVLIPAVETSKTIFSVKRVERIEFSDHSTSDRAPTVMFCSEVEMRDDIIIGDVKGQPSVSSAAPLERVSLVDDTLILQCVDRAIFHPSIGDKTCVARKSLLDGESSPARRRMLEDVFSAEQCDGFAQQLSALIDRFSAEANRVIKLHQAILSELLLPVCSPGGSSCALPLSRSSETFVHIFRAIQAACVALTQFVDIGTVQSINASTNNNLCYREDDQVRGFQVGSPDISPPQKVEPSSVDRTTTSYSVADFTGSQLFVSTTNEAIKLLAQCISSSALPLMAILPVPFDVCTQDWTVVVHVVCMARAALSGLTDAVTRVIQPTSGVLDDIDKDGIFSSCDQLVSTLFALDAALDDYRDRSVLALCASYELSAVDSMHRQEWGSHNAFFRDKKVSHGVLGLTSSVRVALHDLGTFCGTGSRGPSDRFPETVTYVSLQLLLATQSMALRNYLMLRPSRVRLFQWRLDLCHVLYTTMDSMAQLVAYKRSCITSVDTEGGLQAGWRDWRSLTLSQINVEGGGSSDALASLAVAVDLNALFTTDDDQFLWAEMGTLVLYTAMTIVIATNSSSSDVGDLLASLQAMVAADQSSDLAAAASPPTVAEVVDLFKLALPASVVDHAFSMPVSSSGGHPSSFSSFDLTGDSTAYCGHFSHPVSAGGDASPCLHLIDEDERALFVKEQKAKPDNPYAGTRGVVFARIASMLTVPMAPDSGLWTCWHRHRSAVMCLHCELGDDDSTSRSVSSLLASLLPRRFEMQVSEYPKLTEVQINNAEKVRAFLNRNSL